MTYIRHRWDKSFETRKWKGKHDMLLAQLGESVELELEIEVKQQQIHEITKGSEKMISAKLEMEVKWNESENMTC